MSGKPWKRADVISLAGLLVQAFSVFGSLLATRIHELLGLRGHLPLVLSIAVVGISGATVGVKFALRLPNGPQKVRLLSALTAVGLAFAVALYRATEVAPLVIVGSSNVRAYLHSRLPTLAGTWLDVGSDEGQVILFHAFEYGRSNSPGDNRQGLIALSSYGTHKMSALFETPLDDETRKDHTPSIKIPNPSDETKRNYVLSIQVNNPPLALLYSDSAAHAQTFPHIDRSDPEYDWVTCADVAAFYRDPGHGACAGAGPALRASGPGCGVLWGGRGVAFSPQCV